MFTHDLIGGRACDGLVELQLVVVLVNLFVDDENEGDEGSDRRGGGWEVLR